MPVNLPPLDVRALLRRYGLKPDKGLGQNFLVDQDALAGIVAAAAVTPDDDVLEIGPGLGSLTRLLAANARQVTAVELDERLLPALRLVLADFANTRLVQGDILRLNPAELMPSSGYQVVANIPYYITSAVFRHLLEAPVRPRNITLTIQQEVAERITAQPGDMSLLAVSVQVYGAPRLALRLPAAAFYPAPKVDSAVVVTELFAEPAVPPEELKLFFQVVKAGFSQKRKTLRNALSAGLRLAPAETAALLASVELDPQQRAETLAVADWARLASAYAQLTPPA
jgi:16S rRNA (adenine1518-N6/adenine1519-N6)-dimethyltransferase